MLLIDLSTTDGPTGHAYVFCYDALGQRVMRDILLDAAEAVAGQPLSARDLDEHFYRRYRLLGARGVVGMALAGIDIAVWDALAQAAGEPLARHLGGDLTPVPAYNSNGLGLIGATAAAVEAVELLEEGYRAVKLRLGYPTLAEDLEAVRAVRSAIGDDVDLLVDYNQLLTPAEAHDRCSALDAYKLAWIEEPIVHDDFVSLAALTRAIETPIQFGENFMGPYQVRHALDVHASDLVMFDLQRIGGVSGWQSAATTAAQAGIPVSTHLFPEVSAHLLAVTATRDRLEMVEWANPILQMPLTVVNGHVTPPDVPGTGVAWDESAVAHYIV